MLSGRSKAVVLLCAAAVLGTCAQPPTLLDEVLATGELRVVTRNAPNAYFTSGEGPAGPEYDLIRGFAELLHVRLRLIVVDRPADVLPAVLNGEAHLAAAGLTVNPETERLVDFGPSFQQVTEHLVYREGRRRPRDLRQLRGKHLEVASGTSYVKTLALAQARNPDLVWTENPGADQQELLNRVVQRHAGLHRREVQRLCRLPQLHPGHPGGLQPGRGRVGGLGLPQASRRQPARCGGALFREHSRHR